LRFSSHACLFFNETNSDRLVSKVSHQNQAKNRDMPIFFSSIDLQTSHHFEFHKNGG